MNSEYLDDSYKVERTINSGYFPMSPAANVRESIFSVVLSKILGSSPNGSEINELKVAIQEAEDLDVPEEVVDDVWNVFTSTYVTQGSNEGNLYLIPFHPKVAQSVRPHEARNWGLWYQMLMYDKDGRGFNEKLHERLTTKLNEDINSSNVFEELFVVAAESIGYTEEEEVMIDILPYIQQCADAFQDDIDAWLTESRLSSSEWLQSLRDLFCFHAMTYYVQLAINLRKEFEHLKEDSSRAYQPEIKQVYYGLEDERASQGRNFRIAWHDRGPRGIAGDIYDSWGRLGVMHLIERALQDVEDDGLPDIVTPTEFTQDRFKDARDVCVHLIRNRLADSQRPDEKGGFVEHALAYTAAVRQHYESLPSQRQTPSSLGIRVVRRLGDGDQRKFLKRQRKVGTTFRLNRGSLRFFARMFEIQDQDRHFDRFVQYLQDRGVYLDDRSIEAMLQTLDEMGMISQKSDSGDAIYVQSV